MIGRIKQLAYQKFLSIKYNVTFKSNVKVNQNVQFEGGNAIYDNSTVLDSTLGFGSYIANNSIIRSAEIGRFCAIGDNVRTGLGIHPTEKFVSIHPAFFSLQKQAGFTFVDKQKFAEHKYVDSEKKYFVEIGHDVWIGNNVMIMDGITIGNGAVLAAGSIVTNNVEPYAIYGGLPAKLIRYRFNEETIQKLLNMQWWNKDIEWIKNNADKFRNVDLLLHLHKSK